MRIRHFGFLSNSRKATEVGLCRECLDQHPDPPPRRKLTVAELMKELLDIDINLCPACGRGPLIRTELPARTRAYPLRTPVMDTS